MFGPSRFSLLLAGALTLTLGIKLVVAGGVQNPSFATISDAMAPFFARNGFEIGGATSFAGLPALILRRRQCLMYSVPVAQQGWHQATVRLSLAPDQTLWFAARGGLRRGEQPTWSPLIGYYVRKALRYVGAPMQYPPVLALVASGECDLAHIEWSALPSVDFVRLSLQ